MFEPLFNKVAGLHFIKKRFQHKCFPVNIANLLRTPPVGASLNCDFGNFLSNIFLIHSIAKLERYLLRFHIISATLLLSPQNVGLGTKTLQSGKDFNIADFNRKIPSTIFL